MAPNPPAFVTVDVVLLTIRAAALQVLMVRRGSAPFKGWPALPGGFVRQREDLATAARRKLHEETGLQVQHLEQLATFGSPRRDSRPRTVSVAYLGVLPSLADPAAGTNEVSAAWHPVAEMLGRRLPFDQTQILDLGVERARSKLGYTPLAAAFCEDSFTIAELRRSYEIVWGRAVDPGNFHRKVTGADGFVLANEDRRPGSRGRPAAVYRRGPTKNVNPPILR